MEQQIPQPPDNLEPQESMEGLDYRHESPPEVDDLVELIDGQDVGALDKFLALLHPADLALLLEILGGGRWPKVLARLSISQIANLMEELPDHLRDDLAEHLKQEQLTKVIEELDSDDAADVLAALPEPLAEALIRSLAKEDRLEVESLLRYPEDTAGGLMQLELVAVPEQASVGQAVEAIRALADEVGEFHFVFVVDAAGRLAGQLGLEQLILAKPERPIRELMSRDLHVVTPEVDQEQVAQMFKRYDLVTLPVVDERGRLLGLIQHDDVVDVLEEEANEDIMHMAGAVPHELELVYTNQPLKIALVRLPWLLATLVGLSVPALLVWLFQLSFPNMLALIPFIPVIGAMGGNVGSQSSTIVVRGFAIGRVDVHNLGRYLGKELLIALLMGVACGLAAGVLATLWHGNLMLSLTVCLALLGAIIGAALMGVLIPYFFRLIRVDPAIAAGPAVTTLSDTLSISIYYLIALGLISR